MEPLSEWGSVVKRNWICVIPLLLLWGYQLITERWMKAVYTMSGEKIVDPGDVFLELSDFTRGDTTREGIEYLEGFAAASSWGTSIFLLIVLQILSITCAAWVIWMSTRRSSPKIRVICFAIILLSCAVSLAVKSAGSVNLYGERTVYSTPSTPSILEAIKSRTGVDVDGPVSFATIAISVCATAFACAFGTLIWKNSHSVESPESLQRKVFAGQLLLYIFSLTVVVGTIEMRLLFEWPMWWVTDKETKLAIQHFASATSAAAGAKTSLMLLLTCLPVFFLLNHRVQICAEKFSGVSDPIKRSLWIKDVGFHQSALGNVGVLGAIIAPAFSNTIFSSIASAVSRGAT